MSTEGERIDVETEDGTMNTWVYRPSVGAGPWPVVIVYMDGLGIRDALCAMAQRLAGRGYVVLLPNMYYRAGAYTPFDPATVFSDQAERERLMGLVRSVKPDAAMRDTATLLRVIDGLPDVEGRGVGCVGYCLGGFLTMHAAIAHPDRVAAAASIHGGWLVTDAPDSHHAHAEKIRARVYVGVAESDHNLATENTDRLRSALDAAGVHATVEVYPQARHGFAVTDLPVYDRDSAERHWQRVFDLFAKALPG